MILRSPCSRWPNRGGSKVILRSPMVFSSPGVKDSKFQEVLAWLPTIGQHYRGLHFVSRRPSGLFQCVGIELLLGREHSCFTIGQIKVQILGTILTCAVTPKAFTKYFSKAFWNSLKPFSMAPPGCACPFGDPFWVHGSFWQAYDWWSTEITMNCILIEKI